jgi:hypothetical protein
MGYKMSGVSDIEISAKVEPAVGWKSRKLAMALISVATVAGLAYPLRADEGALGIVCGAVVSICVAYIAGNVRQAGQQ